MELKDQVTQVVDNVKHTVADVKDTASEAVHRLAAEGEKQERKLAGDNMTTDAKAVSMLSEAKQTAQAKIDVMKRDERAKTP